MAIVYDEVRCRGCSKEELCKKDGGPLIKMAREAGMPEEHIARIKTMDPTRQVELMLMLSLMPRRPQPAPLPVKA